MSRARLVITAVVVEIRAEVARAYKVSEGWVSRLLARYLQEREVAFRGSESQMSARQASRQITKVKPESVGTQLHQPAEAGTLGSMIFERITVEPDKMAGQPCIRGFRIPVATVVAMVADGMAPAEIVAELPDLEVEDVAEALRYAAEAVRERELPLRHPA